MVLKDFCNSLFKFLYPNRCIGCLKLVLDEEEYLCIECIFNFPILNYLDYKDNELYNRINSFTSIDGGVAYLFFSEGGIARNIIHSIKYESNFKLAHFIAKKFVHHIRDKIDVDFILPVPLHPKKKMKRGYNQSDLIAEEMAKELKILWSPNALVRVKNTSSQTKKSAESRSLNVENAFRVVENDVLEGKKILLVDDVITTGATVSECIKAVKTAKPLTIVVASVAFAY